MFSSAYLCCWCSSWNACCPGLWLITSEQCFHNNWGESSKYWKQRIFKFPHQGPHSYWMSKLNLLRDNISVARKLFLLTRWEEIWRSQLFVLMINAGRGKISPVFVTDNNVVVDWFWNITRDWSTVEYRGAMCACQWFLQQSWSDLTINTRKWYTATHMKI